MPKVMTDYGPYTPLSDRLPQFLDQYPPSDGYGVEIEVKDLLAIKPGLSRLYAAAIEKGRSFKAAGLPPLPSASSVIVVAYLTRHGERLTSAQTYQSIDWDKDLEIAETRARQRLVAALGFDGSALDIDEPIGNPDDRVAIQHTDLEPAASGPSPDVASASVPEPLDQQVMDLDLEPELTESASADSAASGPITPALQSAVDLKLIQLRDAGVEVTDPTSKREALQVLRTVVPEPPEERETAA